MDIDREVSDSRSAAAVRFRALFAASAAERRFGAILRYGRKYGVPEGEMNQRIGRGLDAAGRLLSESWWGGLSAREFVLRFRAPGARRSAAQSWRRLVVSAACYLSLRGGVEDEERFAHLLREDVEQRLAAVAALLDDQTYLVAFEDVYRDLVLSVAYRHAVGAVGRPGSATDGVKEDLCAAVLNHLQDVAQRYGQRRRDGVPVGLPVPEAEPEAPLKSWVAVTVSRRMIELVDGIASGEVAPERVFLRREIRRAKAAELGNSLTTLPAGEFEVFCMDRFLHPVLSTAETGGHPDFRRDGRDRIIAELLGITLVAVHNRRSRYRSRLGTGDAPSAGPQP